jgi:hypothetical protein
VPPVTKSKKWLASNFKLEVDGLPTSRVAQIKALSIKQQIIEFRPGDGGDTQYLPGKLEYPNLVFSVPEIDAQPWLDYFESFVLKGNQGPENEMTGSIVFLSPDLKEELMRISMAGLGIFKCAPANEEPSKAKAPSSMPEMYVEEMKISFTGISA